jgi:hypothetical protein
MKALHSLVIFALFLSFSIASLAQSTRTLKGIVTDENNTHTFGRCKHRG